MITLQQGSTLQGGRYRIERVLGQGGFGITYLAEDCVTRQNVAIKEFFMKEYCSRDDGTSRVTLGTEGSRETVIRSREKFLKEAHVLAGLNHPHIIHVQESFEENGTAYYVMDYAEGGSLADLLKRKGFLFEFDATQYIVQVADALAYIHSKKKNHLDVKPANILLNDRNEAILIDFGLSKQYDALTGGQTSTTPVGYSEGYAPIEQCKQGGVPEFSPETDIYALGATFFKLLTGKTPPSASDVFEDGVPVDELKARGVNQPVIDLIVQAMEPKKKNRMKDVRLFLAMKRESNSVSSPSSRLHSAVVEKNETTVLKPKSNDVNAWRASKSSVPSSDVENTRYINERKSTTGSAVDAPAAPKKKRTSTAKKRPSTASTKPRTSRPRKTAKPVEYEESESTGCISSLLVLMELAAFILCVVAWFYLGAHNIIEKSSQKGFLLLGLAPWVRRLWRKLF